MKTDNKLNVNPIQGGMKFQHSSKNNLNQVNVVPVINNSQNISIIQSVPQITQSVNKDFSFHTNNVKETISNFKDFTYNEEFYQTLSKNKILPIINQTGASRLLNEIYQNHNASVSSTTGQFTVMFFFRHLLRK